MKKIVKRSISLITESIESILDINDMKLTEVKNKEKGEKTYGNK